MSIKPHAAAAIALKSIGTPTNEQRLDQLNEAEQKTTQHFLRFIIIFIPIPATIYAMYMWLFLWPWFVVFLLCAALYFMWSLADPPSANHIMERDFRSEIRRLIARANDDIAATTIERPASYRKAIDYLKREDVMKQAVGMLRAIHPKPIESKTWDYRWVWEREDALHFLELRIETEKGYHYRMGFFPVNDRNCATPGVTLDIDDDHDRDGNKK